MFSNLELECYPNLVRKLVPFCNPLIKHSKMSPVQRTSISRVEDVVCVCSFVCASTWSDRHRNPQTVYRWARGHIDISQKKRQKRNSILNENKL